MRSVGLTPHASFEYRSASPLRKNDVKRRPRIRGARLVLHGQSVFLSRSYAVELHFVACTSLQHSAPRCIVARATDQSPARRPPPGAAPHAVGEAVSLEHDRLPGPSLRRSGGMGFQMLPRIMARARKLR